MVDDDTKKLDEGTKGKSFMALRDEALIRLYYNTGARLSEIGNGFLTCGMAKGAGGDSAA
jgi:integrase/recombinase XerC